MHCWFGPKTQSNEIVQYCPGCCRKEATMASLHRPIVVLFGDSLTQQAGYGWHGLLQEWLQRKADVINRGFSGYNTKWIRDILPQIFPESSSSSTSHPLLPVEFVTVLLGSNDCVTEGEPQHVSLGDFARNLLQIVNWIHEHASQRVILMSPPPVNSEKWGNRSCRRLQHYAAVVEEISRRTNCVFLDLYQEMASHEGGFNSLLSDGLHLNEEGNRVVFKALQRRIQEKYPHITELTMDQPDWKQLAGISPES